MAGEGCLERKDWSWSGKGYVSVRDMLCWIVSLMCRSREGLSVSGGYGLSTLSTVMVSALLALSRGGRRSRDTAVVSEGCGGNGAGGAETKAEVMER